MLTTTLQWLVLAVVAVSPAAAEDRVVVLLGDSTTLSRRSAPEDKYVDAVRDQLALRPKKEADEPAASR